MLDTTVSTSVSDGAPLAQAHHHALVRQGEPLHAPLEGEGPGVPSEVDRPNIRILNGCLVKIFLL